jgi:outer membrane protein insertion porin family
VVLDRLSFRPGDIVDIREVRNSERRLKASELFIRDPAEGDPPRIVIRPPNLADASNIARGSNGPIIRGQSPDAPLFPPLPVFEFDGLLNPFPLWRPAILPEVQDDQP